MGILHEGNKVQYWEAPRNHVLHKHLIVLVHTLHCMLLQKSPPQKLGSVFVCVLQPYWPTYLL